MPVPVRQCKCLILAVYRNRCDLFPRWFGGTASNAGKTMNSQLHIRSYEDAGTLHSHDFLQVVLPMDGELEIEIGGHGARLSPSLLAFIAPGEVHTQQGLRPNRSLVLDTPANVFPAAVFERLGRERFFTAAPDMRRLIEFAGLRSQTACLDEGDRAALAHLVTGAIAAEPVLPAPGQRFGERLGEKIRLDPAADWPAERMAREMGVSRSVLYRCLAAEGAEAPARYVTRIRLQLAQAALAGTAMPLAEIALRSGFSDQSALTRAMRRETGHTPGVWRRRASGTPGQ